MSYQTEDQQIEQLKEWWKDNGTPLIVGAVLGLSGFFGWKYWTEKQIVEQEQASNLYSTVTEQLKSEDSAKLVENAQAVKTRFPDTSYAILSAFHLAKIAVEDDDLDKAVIELTWVLDNHKGNELTEIAKIRLARILVAQQKSDQALPLLSFSNDSGYFEIASLIKGDALIALDKKAEALEAYKAAENAGKTTANHPTLKLAIDELTSGQSSSLEATSDSTENETTEADAVKNESSETSTEETTTEETGAEKTDLEDVKKEEATK